MPYFTPTGTTHLIARRGYGPTDGVLDKIGSFIKSGAGAALSVYSGGQQAQGQAQAYQNIAQQQAQAAAQAAGGRSSMPGWLLPAAVGAVGLGAVFLLTRKRKNPQRRRR